MFLKIPPQPRLLIFSALCVLLLSLVFSCGEPPTGVEDDPGGGGMSGSTRLRRRTTLEEEPQ